jgi:lysozyme family protein
VRLALIDDAVMAGVPTAVKTLQRLVGTEPDGILGPITLQAVQHVNGGGEWLLIRLVQARAHRLARIVETDHSQARYLVGWIDRCLSFLG